MGFFSKLFGKKEITNVKIEVKESDHSSPVHSNIPTLQGDYAKTIFLYANSGASAVRPASTYPGYLLYKCGITDAPAYHQKMINEGYFRECTLSECLTKLKVAELKQLLESIGAPQTGKKADLIQRIVDTGNGNIIHKYFPNTMYTLSERGQRFLDDHDDYVFLYRYSRWGISWQEFDAIKNSSTVKYNRNDIIWGIFNERVLTSVSHGRNEHYNMYELLMIEEKRTQALQALLYVFYTDVRGIQGYPFLQGYQKGYYTKKDLRDLYSRFFTLAPVIIKNLADLNDVYDPSYIDHTYDEDNAINICPKKLFQSAVESIMNGAFDEITFDKKLKAAFNKFVDQL